MRTMVCGSAPPPGRTAKAVSNDRVRRVVVVVVDVARTMAMSEDQRDEAVADALLQMVERNDALANATGDDLRRYAYVCVRCRAIDRARAAKRRRHVPAEFDRIPAPTATPEEELIAEEREALERQALDLAADYSSLASALAGASSSEAARAEGCAPSTVWRRRSRDLSDLRARLNR